MKKITLDTGLEQVRIGGGVLRFHPQDPNLYVRFRQATEKLQEVEKELVETAGKGDCSGTEAVQLLAVADGKMKEILSWVFGPGNDFDAILQGVNLLAVATNGQRVVTNLFTALEPLLTQGAQRCAGAHATQAAAAAKARRAAQ